MLDESENSGKKSEINDIALTSAEINEQILKVLIYFENCADIKLRKSKQSVDTSLIGDLVNPIDIHQETSITRKVSFSRNVSSSKPTSSEKTLVTRPKKIHYKLPLNTKLIRVIKYVFPILNVSSPYAAFFLKLDHFVKAKSKIQNDFLILKALNKQ